ncbi:IclR family transcriptional regulator [Paralimibaculum aggregatum]|uniref:IclR family transcriptional regulator n=1 Tax=Paralimibaculum aggregatum TaxID=3036245 RepID=A0ABQ6LSQ5_9RHOB|nr:IclR family transcriptional regulator C-terminal domain-containing protein [Limibaculum sp. NKW23]GMG85107.1 IclR family transcriptional regulator [Limibaculum sp. NKW23]
MDVTETPESGKDWVRSLERGMRVLEAFEGSSSGMTLSEVAQKTGLSRATARRLLLTLAGMGYVRTDGSHFALQPRILTLSHAYLSSVAVTDIMMPYMEQVLEGTLHVSSSASVLDDTNVVFVCGVPAKGLVRTSMTVGLTFPAALTSTGRVLLAQRPLEQIDDILERSTLERLTPRTIVDKAELRRLILEARRDGYATNDAGLDLTIKSVAVPIFNRENICVASISISCHNMDRSIASLVEEFLPRLRSAADSLSRIYPKFGLPIK